MEFKKSDFDFESPISLGNEDDLILLETLIASPVFSALKRVLDKYRAQCQSVLLTETDTTKIFQTQGRIIGVNIVERLPSLLVAQRRANLEKKKEKENPEKRSTNPNPKT